LLSISLNKPNEDNTGLCVGGRDIIRIPYKTEEDGRFSFHKGDCRILCKCEDLQVEQVVLVTTWSTRRTFVNMLFVIYVYITPFLYACSDQSTMLGHALVGVIL
jgi:hypothetical protein